MKRWIAFLLCLVMLTACQPVMQTDTDAVATSTAEPTMTKAAATETSTQTTTAAKTKPLSDPRVRAAIEYCIDRQALFQAAYPWIDGPQKFFRSSPFSDDSSNVFPPDPTKGRELVEAAGFTNLRLQLVSTTAEFRKLWIDVFIDQMQNCNITITPEYEEAAILFEEGGTLARGEFDLAALGWVEGATQPITLEIARCDAIPSKENNWRGQNLSGWCSPDADIAAKQTAAAIDLSQWQSTRQLLIEAYRIDVPGITLFTRIDGSAAQANLQNYSPEENPVFTWNIAAWRIPEDDTIVIGERSEPASLAAFDDSYVTNVVRSILYGVDYTQSNYGFEPITLERLPTLESGASLVMTTVQEGDAVVDTNGEAVTLIPGTRLYDTSGNEVPYTGGPFETARVTARFDFLDSLQWSDGKPVTREDYELGYQATCNAPLETFTNHPRWCDLIESVTFLSDTAYEITWKPGYRSQSTLLPPIPRLPAHLKLEDGRTLAEAPVGEMNLLMELRQPQLTYGPYVLQHWEYGREMLFTANPYYFLGPAATETIVIRFIEQGKVADELLNGSIDIAGADSLLPEELVRLAQEPEDNIRMYLSPSQTIEMIWFQLRE